MGGFWEQLFKHIKDSKIATTIFISLFFIAPFWYVSIYVLQVKLFEDIYSKQPYLLIVLSFCLAVSQFQMNYFIEKIVSKIKKSENKFSLTNVGIHTFIIISFGIPLTFLFNEIFFPKFPTLYNGIWLYRYFIYFITLYTIIFYLTILITKYPSYDEHIENKRSGNAD